MVVREKTYSNHKKILLEKDTSEVWIYCNIILCITRNIILLMLQSPFWKARTVLDRHGCCGLFPSTPENSKPGFSQQRNNFLPGISKTKEKMRTGAAFRAHISLHQCSYYELKTWNARCYKTVQIFTVMKHICCFLLQAEYRFEFVKSRGRPGSRVVFCSRKASTLHLLFLKYPVCKVVLWSS